MSDLRRSLPLKAAACFLTILFLALSAISALAFAISFDMGYYTGRALDFTDTDAFTSLRDAEAVNYLYGGEPSENVVVLVEDPGHPGAVLRQSGAVPASYDAVSETEVLIPDSAPGRALEAGTYRVTVYVLDFDDPDSAFYGEHLFFSLFYPLRNVLLPAAVLSAVLMLVCLVYLLCAAGHRRGAEGIPANVQDRIPLDLYLLGEWVLAYLLLAMWRNISGIYIIQLVFLSVTCLALAVLALALLLTVATRLKLGRFWENTICWRALRWACRVLRRCGRALVDFVRILPLTWRAIALVCLVLLAQTALIYLGGVSYSGSYYLLALLMDAALAAGAALLSWQLQKLKDTGKALAEGDLEAQVDTSRMFWDLRTHGEHLNAIGLGMSRAVDQRMRSERLKTELITNVSHDIKTPLTSIINYVDLLAKEDLPDTAADYVAVLDRQSRRLKKLTEDLVEASKASTGNITVHLQPIVVNEIVRQAMGDYDQRLAAGKLEVIVTASGEDLAAMADGRLLWRVLDNLLSNVCKYALSGSRVYLDLERAGDRVRLTVKNISRDPLNISAEELMERFVRGDASRHTEGSGLGLSIARSLMELTGGTFSIGADGDLFKAELTLKGA